MIDLLTMTPRGRRRKLIAMGFPVPPELDTEVRRQYQEWNAAKARKREERRQAEREAELMRKAKRRVNDLKREGLPHLEAAVWNQYRRELEKLRADRLGAG